MPINYREKLILVTGNDADHLNVDLMDARTWQRVRVVTDAQTLFPVNSRLRYSGSILLPLIPAHDQPTYPDFRRRRTTI